MREQNAKKRENFCAYENGPLTDHSNYKRIMKNTNALRKNYEADRSFRQVRNNNEFNTEIKKFYEISGLPKWMVEQRSVLDCNYVYWNDLNELVDRLKLLIAEKSAGNNSHNNEIMSIIEELREEKVIY